MTIQRFFRQISLFLCSTWLGMWFTIGYIFGSEGPRSVGAFLHLMVNVHRAAGYCLLIEAALIPLIIWFWAREARQSHRSGWWLMQQINITALPLSFFTGCLVSCAGTVGRSPLQTIGASLLSLIPISCVIIGLQWHYQVKHVAN